MTRELPRGIDRTPFGFRAFVCISRNGARHRRSKRFPSDTSLETIKTWRETARVDLRRELAGSCVPTGSGFLADADRYLEAVQAMPTYKERRRHIQEWAAVFGDRLRSTITAAEIRTQRDRWLTVGPKCVQVRGPDGKVSWQEQPLPLSASAVNHRLRALENLYSVLDGRHAYNPVRDVPEADPPDVAPRAIPYALIATIFRTMQPSATRARLMVIAYIGLSHSQLVRLQPDDVNLRTRTLFLRRRRKGQVGRDTKGVTVPLTAKGVQAMRELHRYRAWGKFSASSMRKAFKRACAELKLPDSLTPYDLRHSFGTLAYASSGDLHATGVLLGHRDPRTTQRYALAAVDPRLMAAVDAMRFSRSRGGVRVEEMRPRMGSGVNRNQPVSARRFAKT